MKSSPIWNVRVAMFFAMLIAPWGMSLAAAQQTPVQDAVPPIVLDVLEGYVWSETELYVTPGQRLIVTNRDVNRHSFVVDEWALDVNLPTLKPQSITVPEDVELGTEVAFYSGVARDRDQGLVGTIFVVDEADLGSGGESSEMLREPRIVIQATDAFEFRPRMIEAEPGALLEVVNTGNMEHHFVVDEWGINQVLYPGEPSLVRIPRDAQTGTSFDFYCSIPGHQVSGMDGMISIVPPLTTIAPAEPIGSNRRAVLTDLQAFLPDQTAIGSGWSEIRRGSTEALVPNSDPNRNVFPQSGVGAIYVGPEGARVTVLVMPMANSLLPVNQVTEAVSGLQTMMTREWSIDRVATVGLEETSPPIGCDIAVRRVGIVPVMTLPAGATSCQVRSANLAIFVTVEGAMGPASGVEAADTLISNVILQSSANREDSE